MSRCLFSYLHSYDIYADCFISRGVDIPILYVHIMHTYKVL